jgi:hypothetical protein
MKVRTLAVCTVFLAFAAFADETAVKPGKWQLTMQVEMPGIPVKLPVTNFAQCITESDAKSLIPQDKNSKDCKFSDYQVTASTVSWSMDCAKDNMKGTGQLSYTAETLTGAMQVNKDGQDFTVKYDGKHAGDCDK